MTTSSTDMRLYEATAATIAGVQLPDGCIPHIHGSIADPWNHVEAAMALDVMGRHNAAADAYTWLVARQRTDGAWGAAYKDDAVTDATLDANFVAYFAAGAWHHYVTTSDERFLEMTWPAVERAMGFVLGLQAATGAILWARDAGYRPWPGALLTSSSCIHLSLRCAVAVAATVGEERPDWELALASLADAVANRPEAFEAKDSFSMDWYYPVLAGVVTGEAAHERLREGWSHFVEPGLGARCVAERRWITSGETAELILALDAAGWDEAATSMLDWVQHLRADDGAYWMGATFPDGTVWPQDKPTWASGAVILAADALSGSSPASGFFRGDTFPDIVGSALPDPL